MPTIRSEYSIDQFRHVLQKLAHKIAIDAVKNLNRGHVRITINGPRFSDVETSETSIRFYAKHMSYHESSTRAGKEWWGFDVEEKLYLTSGHCTKISFVEERDASATAAREKTITAFIEKIMAEASMKPVPRFSMDGYTKRKV